MGKTCISGVAIKGICSAVPKKVVKTDAVNSVFSEKELRKFIKTTGIKERRFVEDDVCASDLGFYAANKLIEDLDIDKNSINAIVFLSQTPDYKIPFTSNILQEKLGLSTEIFTYDINAGCAGYISGLAFCMSLAKMDNIDKVLLITAETMSKILSKKDRSTSLMFGDGAAATLIEKDKSAAPVFISLNSDGKGSSVIQIPDGGCRNPISTQSLDNQEYEDGSIRNNTQLMMNGGEVFDFTMRVVAKNIAETLDFSGFRKGEMSSYVLHQSNKFIINLIGNELGLDKERLVINIDRFGNTSSVSIPLAITSDLKGEIEQTDKNLLLSGYGAGLTYGSAIINCKKLEYLKLIEV